MMKIEREVGAGKHCVYIYYFPSSASGARWPCKVGRAKHHPESRIKQQQASMQEEPVIGLLLHTDDPVLLESLIHARYRSQQLATYGREWFMLNPATVAAEAADGQFPDLALHEQLRVLRRRRNLTQTQLARLAGLRQATISEIESGEDAMLSTLNKVLAVLQGKLAIL